jgi:hypothetical protein
VDFDEEGWDQDLDLDPNDVDDDDVSDDGSVAQRKPTHRQRKRPGTMAGVAQGGSGKKKTRFTKSAGSTLFELSPVTPQSHAELAIVLQIIQEEQGRKPKLTLKEYEATAHRYNAAVFELFHQGSVSSAREVRYAPTTASLLQQFFRKERSAASRLQQKIALEMALAHTATAKDDATATSTLRRSIQNVIEASDAAADAADTLAAMPSSAPLHFWKRQLGSRDGEKNSKHRRFEERFRRQTLDVRLSDIQSWSDRTLPVRTLRRLAGKLGLSYSRKKTPEIVADVKRAWERDHPNTEILTLEPEVQPEPGT